MANKKWSQAWEKIDWETVRLKVPGGWLVNHVSDNGKLSTTPEHQIVSESMVFIPDSEHQWNIK